MPTEGEEQHPDGDLLERQTREQAGREERRRSQAQTPLDAPGNSILLGVFSRIIYEVELSLSSFSLLVVVGSVWSGVVMSSSAVSSVSTPEIPDTQRQEPDARDEQHGVDHRRGRDLAAEEAEGAAESA
jgi:hypothetical protein